jgi:hypothetical protein
MDPRRELGLINKHVRRRNREAGEHVVWYEFKKLSTGGSLYDDVYDEGAPGIGGKAYAKGVNVPTIYVEEVEDSYRAIAEGRQPTQLVRLTILFKDLVSAGIEDAREYRDHLNDVFEYDSRFYKIQDYKVRGRLHRDSPSGEAIAVVAGYEVFLDQEMPFSNGPRNPEVYDLPWPSTFPS